MSTAHVFISRGAVQAITSSHNKGRIEDARGFACQRAAVEAVVHLEVPVESLEGGNLSSIIGMTVLTGVEVTD